MLAFNAQLKAKRIGLATDQTLNFIPQGNFDFEIMGPLNKFRISPTSHIKSGTYIECSGGVDIGAYFHTGRGLTIFSATHNWKSSEAIPYDSKVIIDPVIIKNFVWHTVHYIIHMLNIKSLNNPKKAIKEVNKSFYIQTSKLVDEYIQIIDSLIKK